jgi:hypothetical protein
MNEMDYLKNKRFTEIIYELVEYASKHLNTQNTLSVEEISKAYKKRLNELIGPHLFILENQ